MAKLVHKLSVGSLVNRCEQSGDIHFRFSSRSNAADGIRGHQKVQKTRGADYLAEQTVSDTVCFDDFDIEVNGRADGCWPQSDAFRVEEIKTIKVDVDKIPQQVARLHWAQVKVYGYLLGRQYGVDAVTLQLTYYHLDEKQQYTFDDHWTIEALSAEYRRMINQYAKFLVALTQWQKVRNESIETLEMPFGDFRPGQREMAVSVYRAMAAESQVVLQAPTGIGKTMGSLFPATKALNDQNYTRIFYLSAKTSGQQMAQTAIEQMRNKGLQLRDVTLTAKEKICFNPGMACDPDQCQFAKGYYDKMPNVVFKAISSTRRLDRQGIEALARDHELCPFELSLDLSDVADVVIGDYNYVFDPTVYLRRHFDEPEKYVLLMDETHNLVDRGRDMFSAELCKEDVLALRRMIGSSAPSLKKALTAVNTAMLSTIKAFNTAHESGQSAGKFSNDNQVNQKSIDSTNNSIEGRFVFPVSLEKSLTRFIGVAESWLDEHLGSSFHAELLTLYFDVLRFVRVAEQADKHYACIVEKARQKTIIKWFCVNPASGLAHGYERMRSSVCFSATLGPQNYFKSLLGLNEDSPWYQLESPFDPENLGVFATTFLSTTYHNRQGSLYDLVDTLATVISSRRGNYIVYFPSHAYLKMVLEKFRERYPNECTLVQETSMSDEAREEFLNAFNAQDNALLGFAVMGGIFGEGVDLKGGSLIGAIVVGVGLPQIGLERNLIRDYFDAEGDSGFEFAYQFPGMNRVLQTAGRVIRSEKDQGIVCLIDHRFNEASYAQLFPPNWRVTQARSAQHLSQQLVNFWTSRDVIE